MGVSKYLIHRLARLEAIRYQQQLADIAIRQAQLQKEGELIETLRQIIDTSTPPITPPLTPPLTPPDDVDKKQNGQQRSLSGLQLGNSSSFRGQLIPSLQHCTDHYRQQTDTIKQDSTRALIQQQRLKQLQKLTP